MPDILDEPNKFKLDLCERQYIWTNRRKIEKQRQPQLGILLEIFNEIDEFSIKGRHDLLSSHLGMIKRYCEDVENLVNLNENLQTEERASQDRYDALAYYISDKEKANAALEEMAHEIDHRSDLRRASTALGELVAIKVALLSYTLFPGMASHRNIPPRLKHEDERENFLTGLNEVVRWRASTLQRLLIPEGISRKSPFRSKALRDLIMHLDEKVDAEYLQAQDGSAGFFAGRASHIWFVMPKRANVPESVNLQKLTAAYGISDVGYLIAVSREVGARAQRMSDVLWRAEVLSRRLWRGDV